VPENPGDAAVCGGYDLVSETVPESDREAEFARLVLGQQARMLRSIWRVVRDPDLAEDALQDALTILWRKLPSLARHPNPEAFVLRVCLNAACDHVRVRTRRRRREAPLDAGEGAVCVAPADPWQESAVREEVLEAIARLRRREATAILLRALGDESYETIARSLGCSEVTARVHVLHAREKLRRWLSHLCRPSRNEASS
jgi:RNA polymerase sigma-70 factor (ECF subfamily)